MPIFEPLRLDSAFHRHHALLELEAAVDAMGFDRAKRLGQAWLLETAH